MAFFTQTDLLGINLAILFNLAIWLAGLHYFMKLQEKISTQNVNRREPLPGLAVGIASGCIVIVLDRSMAILFNQNFSLKSFEIKEVLAYVFNIIASVSFTAGAIFFGMVFILYYAIPKSKTSP